MPDGKSVELPDLVLPMDLEIDPSKYTSDQIEKAVKAGYQIEVDDGRKAKIIGRIIVKGGRKTDSLDVSK